MIMALTLRRKVWARVAGFWEMASDTMGTVKGGVDKRERECVCVCVFGILVWDVERRSSGEKNACMVRCVRRGVFFFSLKLGEEETISQESLSWSLASSFSPVGGWYGCG